MGPTVLDIPEVMSAPVTQAENLIKGLLVEKKSKLKHIMELLFESCGFKLVAYAVFLGVTVVPFLAIIIGSIYFSHDECPANDKVPVLLIMTGFLAILTSSLDLVILQRRERQREAEYSAEAEDDLDSLASEEEDDGGVSYFRTIQIRRKTRSLVKASNVLKFLDFVLFIYACAIVYGLYPNVQFEQISVAPLSEVQSGESPENSFYCNKILYLFAFWSFTSTFILIGLIITSLCVLGFCL